MRADSKARKDVAITLYKRGKSVEECARICGYGKDYVRQFLTREGLWDRKFVVNTERETKVVEMIKSGFNSEEIIKALGYKSDTSVFRIANKHGLHVMTGCGQRKQELHEAMRTYKKEGHTREEVAELFGVNVGTVTSVCKGINPQKADRESLSKKSKEQQQKTLSAREEKAKAQIAQYGYEYVGGYTNTDAFVTIRCPKCGTVFERSMTAIRHPGTQTIVCPGCVEIEKEEKRKAEEERKRLVEQERIRKAEEKAKAAEEKEKAKLHECPVCGKLTRRKIYCSKECANKIYNKNHELKRDRKIKGVMVDKDITLQKLYERDHGICYLCGEVCNWDDKEERDGVIICGNSYPSIDHVIPLSRGGNHSWQNVRLAHRICNTRKGAKVQKIASLLITKESETEVK